MKRVSKYILFLVLVIIVKEFLLTVSGVYSFMEFRTLLFKDEIAALFIAVAGWIIPYLFILNSVGNKVRKTFNDLIAYFLTREYRINKLIFLLVKSASIEVVGFMIVAVIFTFVTQGSMEGVLSNLFRVMMWVMICISINVLGYKNEVTHPIFIGCFFVMTEFAVILDYSILNSLFLNLDVGWVELFMFVGISCLSYFGMIKALKKIDF